MTQKTSYKKAKNHTCNNKINYFVLPKTDSILLNFLNRFTALVSILMIYLFLEHRISDAFSVLDSVKYLSG